MVSLCALAGEPVFTLSLPQEKLVSASSLLAILDEHAARQKMNDAVEHAFAELSLRGDFLLHYTQKTVGDLLVRLRAANSVKRTAEKMPHACDK